MVIYVSVDGEKVLGHSSSPMDGCVEYDAPQEFKDCPFNYKYVNGEFVIDEVQDRILKAKKENTVHLKFLEDTDWKVHRHRDQLDMGIETTLSQEEFINLLQCRQAARECVVNK